MESQGRGMYPSMTIERSMVHPANPSDRRRAGLTIRYSGTDVKNDMSVNPNFKTYLCRGEDTYKHNPSGTPPTTRYGRPTFKPVSNEEAGKS